MNNFRKEQFADIDIFNILDGGDAVNAEQVGKFLLSLLSLYELSHDGKTVKELLVEDWQIVTDGAALSEVLAEVGNPFSADDRLVYNSDIKKYEEDWEKVKSDVLKNRRYFCDIAPIEEFSDSLNKRDFYQGCVFYRGRTHHSKDEPTFKTNEMSCPKNVDKIKAGRANPQGIAYLYLCTDQETPFYEIRSSYLDRVDIGVFKLKKDIKVVDFTQSKHLALFNAYCEGDDDSFAALIKQKVLFDAVGRDLSAPMHSYDTDFEYIPTQYICEYLKVLSYDGILFTSSLKREGTNLVLFNPDDAECVDVRPYEVSEIRIGKKDSKVILQPLS